MTMPMPDYGIKYESSSDTITVFQGEVYAELFLAEQVADPNYSHELSAAQLWAIKKDGNYHLLYAHPDVYEMLEQDFDLSTYIGVIIHTSGWAAPLDNDGSISSAPSEHKERRRVALAACVTDTSVGSALSFPDQEKLTIDPGSATGSLAEALLKFWENNRFN